MGRTRKSSVGVPILKRKSEPPGNYFLFLLVLHIRSTYISTKGIIVSITINVTLGGTYSSLDIFIFFIFFFFPLLHILLPEPIGADPPANQFPN